MSFNKQYESVVTYDGTCRAINKKELEVRLKTRFDNKEGCDRIHRRLMDYFKKADR
jgi:hypothetical protein